MCIWLQEMWEICRPNMAVGQKYVPKMAGTLVNGNLDWIKFDPYPCGNMPTTVPLD